MAQFHRPAPDEYAPYYSRYISLTPDGDLAVTMRNQIAEIRATFGSLTEARAGFAYAPGKWTIKEILGHLIDTERVFCYRAISISRGDPAPLPSYDQDVWVRSGRYSERPIASLVDEWIAVRLATIAFVEGAPDDAPPRRGVASDNVASAQALLYILPGHVNYHFQTLRALYG